MWRYPAPVRDGRKQALLLHRERGDAQAGAIGCRPDARVLRAPPGNRLEALKGDRDGQYSITVNDQYRLCFRWTEAGPEDVEIVDYH